MTIFWTSTTLPKRWLAPPHSKALRAKSDQHFARRRRALECGGASHRFLSSSRGQDIVPSSPMKIALIAVLFAFTANAEVTITIDRSTATPAFHFVHVPPPAKDDAATNAKVEVIAGAVDRNSAGLAALTDGRVPGTEDEPEANLFFHGDSWGGRFRIDLGAVIDIAAVNSYSWHPDTRAPNICSAVDEITCSGPSFFETIDSTSCTDGSRGAPPTSPVP